MRQKIEPKPLPIAGWCGAGAGRLLKFIMANVLAALSGGVDSAVAALLLQQAGHKVTGAYMKNWINEENILGHCPWQEDIEDARAAANTLGIPFRVVNLMDAYRNRVVQYLLDGYAGGVTPNPDVMCNREIKFGAFLEVALAEGFDAIATGHYARLETKTGNCGGTFVRVFEGVDKAKDQTYFLALLQQEQLRHAMFPIGELTKLEVRELARRRGLPVADKKDSQGICFIGRVKMSDFLRTFVPDQPGPIVTVDGRCVGEHRGLHLYTLGQRRGLGVASNTPNKAFVVVAKRPETNTLIVGFDDPSTPGLHSKVAELTSLSFTALDSYKGRMELEARPRYRAPRTPAVVEFNGSDSARITFSTPQRALAPGQICAFYRGEELLGGAVFSLIHPIAS